MDPNISLSIFRTLQQNGSQAYAFWVNASSRGWRTSACQRGSRGEVNSCLGGCSGLWCLATKPLATWRLTGLEPWTFNRPAGSLTQGIKPSATPSSQVLNTQHIQTSSWWRNHDLTKKPINSRYWLLTACATVGGFLAGQVATGVLLFVSIHMSVSSLEEPHTQRSHRVAHSYTLWLNWASVHTFIYSCKAVRRIYTQKGCSSSEKGQH